MEHTKPSDEIFNEIKNVAIEIWQGYDNTYGYVDEKLKLVNSLENISNNAMVFYRMFDGINKMKLINKLSEESINYINNNQ